MYMHICNSIYEDIYVYVYIYIDDYNLGQRPTRPEFVGFRTSGPGSGVTSMEYRRHGQPASRNFCEDLGFAGFHRIFEVMAVWDVKSPHLRGAQHPGPPCDFFGGQWLFLSYLPSYLALHCFLEAWARHFRANRGVASELGFGISKKPDCLLTGRPLEFRPESDAVCRARSRRRPLGLGCC